jgi:hypothetical protein
MPIKIEKTYAHFDYEEYKKQKRNFLKTFLTIILVLLEEKMSIEVKNTILFVKRKIEK